MTTTQREKLERIVAEHDRHQGSYFWRSRTRASSRRAAEFRNELTFRWKGQTVAVEQWHKESCRRVYYRLCVTVDGVKANVATLRKALAGRKVPA